MDLGKVYLKRKSVNILFSAIHPKHGLAWTDGSSIYLSPIYSKDGNAAPVKLGQFQSVISLHWSHDMKRHLCYLCVVYGASLSVWSVRGRSPDLNLKHVRKISATPIPSGCLWHPVTDLLCVLSSNQAALFYHHEFDTRGSYALPEVDSGQITCGAWSKDGLKLAVSFGNVVVVYTWQDVSAHLQDHKVIAWKVPGLTNNVITLVAMTEAMFACTSEMSVTTSHDDEEDFFSLPDSTYTNLMVQSTNSDIVKPFMKKDEIGATEKLFNLKQNHVNDRSSSKLIVFTTDSQPKMLAQTHLKVVLKPDLLCYHEERKLLISGSNAYGILNVFSFDGENIQGVAEIGVGVDKSRPKGLCSSLTGKPCGVFYALGTEKSYNVAFLPSPKGMEYDMMVRFHPLNKYKIAVPEIPSPTPSVNDEQQSTTISGIEVIGGIDVHGKMPPDQLSLLLPGHDNVNMPKILEIDTPEEISIPEKTVDISPSIVLLDKTDIEEPTIQIDTPEKIKIPDRTLDVSPEISLVDKDNVEKPKIFEIGDSGEFPSNILEVETTSFEKIECSFENPVSSALSEIQNKDTFSVETIREPDRSLVLESVKTLAVRSHIPDVASEIPEMKPIETRSDVGQIGIFKTNPGIRHPIFSRNKSDISNIVDTDAIRSNPSLLHPAFRHKGKPEVTPVVPQVVPKVTLEVATPPTLLEKLPDRFDKDVENQSLDAVIDTHKEHEIPKTTLYLSPSITLPEKTETEIPPLQIDTPENVEIPEKYLDLSSAVALPDETEVEVPSLQIDTPENVEIPEKYLDLSSAVALPDETEVEVPSLQIDTPENVEIPEKYLDLSSAVALPDETEVEVPSLQIDTPENVEIPEKYLDLSSTVTLPDETEVEVPSLQIDIPENVEIPERSLDLSTSIAFPDETGVDIPPLKIDTPQNVEIPEKSLDLSPTIDLLGKTDAEEVSIPEIAVNIPTSPLLLEELSDEDKDLKDKPQFKSSLVYVDNINNMPSFDNDDKDKGSGRFMSVEKDDMPRKGHKNTFKFKDFDEAEAEKPPLQIDVLKGIEKSSDISPDVAADVPKSPTFLKKLSYRLFGKNKDKSEKELENGISSPESTSHAPFSLGVKSFNQNEGNEAMPSAQRIETSDVNDGIDSNDINRPEQLRGKPSSSSSLIYVENIYNTINSEGEDKHPKGFGRFMSVEKDDNNMFASGNKKAEVEPICDQDKVEHPKPHLLVDSPNMTNTKLEPEVSLDVNDENVSEPSGKLGIENIKKPFKKFMGMLEDSNEDEKRSNGGDVPLTSSQDSEDFVILSTSDAINLPDVNVSTEAPSVQQNSPTIKEKIVDFFSFGSDTPSVDHQANDNNSKPEPIVESPVIIVKSSDVLIEPQIGPTLKEQKPQIVFGADPLDVNVSTESPSVEQHSPTVKEKIVDFFSFGSDTPSVDHREKDNYSISVVQTESPITTVKSSDVTREPQTEPTLMEQKPSIVIGADPLDVNISTELPSAEQSSPTVKEKIADFFSFNSDTPTVDNYSKREPMIESPVIMVKSRDVMIEPRTELALKEQKPQIVFEADPPDVNLSTESPSVEQHSPTVKEKIVDFFSFGSTTEKDQRSPDKDINLLAGVTSSTEDDVDVDQLQAQVDAQKLQLQKLQDQISTLTRALNDTQCLTCAQNKPLKDSDTLTLICVADGLETEKQFSLEDHRLKLEDVLTAFDVQAIEIDNGDESFQVSASEDGYIPIRFSPGMAVNICRDRSLDQLSDGYMTAPETSVPNGSTVIW